MADATERTVRPWHDVKVTLETLWNDRGMHQDFVYYVGHPTECGWSEDNSGSCPFEDVLDDHDEDHGIGDFRVRVVEPVPDGDDNQPAMEWQPVEWRKVGGNR